MVNVMEIAQIGGYIREFLDDLNALKTPRV